MNNKELKDLMNYISKSGFVEFELEREGFKLKVVKESAHPTQSGNSSTPIVVHSAPQAPAMAQPQVPVPAPPPAAKESSEEGIVQVTAPMVGTFYRSPNPDSAPFVETGDKVQKGQVLCIVEAMKLMNEIESEFTGTIVDAPVVNGQPVEYGEVLFRIRVSEG